MTYVGTSKNGHQVFRTLVLAESDEEAKRKIQTKLRAWWGGDYREESVHICAFGDGRCL